MIVSAAAALRDFLKQESAGGIVLIAAAALALLAANTMFSGSYFGALDTPVTVAVGSFAIDKPLLLWINDGLMAVFFFLVGLEVKREVVEGQLSSWNQASLPLVAAIGGMAMPALIFVGLNMGSPANISGWAIPAATDIAFALGILSLLGPRVPVALKALLLAWPLPGVLRKNRYTMQWASMFILLFFTEGIVRATSDVGLSRSLAWGEVVLSVVFFTATILYLRPFKRAAKARAGHRS